jgi:ATP-binding cassette subfamily B protein
MQLYSIELAAFFVAQFTKNVDKDTKLCYGTIVSKDAKLSKRGSIPMIKLIRKMSTPLSLLAITFLLVQIACDLYIPTLMARIVNNGIVTGDTGYVWSQGGIMLILAVVGVFAALANVFVSARITNRLASDLRVEIFVKALKMDKLGFDKIGTSSMITRNSNDVKQVQTLAKTFLQYLIQVPAYLFGGIFLAYRLSPSLSMMFIYALPLLVIISVGISLYANPFYAKAQKKVDKLNQIYKEGLDGVRVIRAFNKEQTEYDKYEKTNYEYMKTSIRVNTIMSLMTPFVTLLINVAVLFITGLGARGVTDGSVEIGAMMGIISYGTQIITGFMMGATIISMIPRGTVSANRINEVLDMPVTVKDAVGPAGDVSGTILELANVGFKYKGAEKNALDDISLKVSEGQTLAVVGSTGASKSTLVSLMMRFYDADTGSITLGDTDIKRIGLSELHNRISYVPQKSLLFFGTIRDNMLFAKADATDEEIWKALETANADEFVRTLEKGLDSPVEKGGGNFSGGQKQRLCIARAILKPADVYIFDDSFSALDFKTDSEIRKKLKTHLAQPIKIIVAQRISTVMDADGIAVLDAGKLVDYGTHDQLKESSKIYSEIIESQFEDKEAV